jgi:hypothetical protein
MSTQAVTLVIDRPGPSADAALERLTAQLEHADVGQPDPETGVFDIRLEADSREEALTRVLDALAAAGSDDEIVFLEHPDIPEHWRSRPA